MDGTIEVKLTDLEKLISLFDECVSTTRRDKCKIAITLNQQDPSNGAYADTLTFKVEYKSQVEYGRNKDASVTRVVDMFSASDSQPMKVEETRSWNVEPKDRK